MVIISTETTSSVSGSNSSGIFQVQSGSTLTGGISGDFTIYGSVIFSGLTNIQALVSGVGGSNSGNIVTHVGQFVGSGNASTTIYNISHGIGAIPSSIHLEAASPQARATVDVSGTASGIIVTFPIAPASGDVRLYWSAGPTNVVPFPNTSGIFNLQSGSTLQGVTSTSGVLSATSNVIAGIHTGGTTIYKEGATYYARRNSDGVIISGSTVLNGIVQAALNEKGMIYWADASGSYQPSNTLAANPWKLDSFTTLEIAPSATIALPSTFSGRVFEICDTYSGAHVVQNIEVRGGLFQQGGATPSAEWDLFTLESNSDSAGNAGIFNVKFDHVYCKRARRSYNLICTSGTNSFINGCTWTDVTCDYNRQGIAFVMGGSGESSIQTISRNSFVGVIIQADPGATSGTYIMTHAILDIAGKNNSFVNCKLWDVISGQIQCNITKNAIDTTFIASNVTRAPADWEISQDMGIRTYIFGDSQNIGTNASMSNPFYKKTGAWYGIGNAAGNVIGDGLLAGLALVGSGSTISTTYGGLGKRVDTGASSGAIIAGLRTASAMTSRIQQPVVMYRANLGQLSGCRFFFGFSSSTTPGVNTEETILSGITGFGIGYSCSGATRTNFQVYSNVGAAGTTIADTGVQANSGLHTFYVAAFDSAAGTQATTKFMWRIDNISGQFGDVTTTIPGSTTVMTVGAFLGSLASDAKTLDSYTMFIHNNNNDTN